MPHLLALVGCSNRPVFWWTHKKNGDTGSSIIQNSHIFAYLLLYLIDLGQFFFFFPSFLFSVRGIIEWVNQQRGKVPVVF